jgi:hypothetical protein
MHRDGWRGKARTPASSMLIGVPALGRVID